jgi:hypothetical protein
LEPPEQEQEDPEDPAAGADLEDLLEQFREPEEAPRQRANPLWFVSAILLSVLACWLALRASRGGSGDDEKSAALAGERLPGKASLRTARVEDDRPGDVLADYLARCEKGMTAREVRWIVEDFQRAGLGVDPLSDFSKIAQSLNDPSREIEGKVDTALAARLRTAAVEYARNQREWYGNALADGLRPNAAQKMVLKERLDAALAEDREQFENRLKALLLYLEAASSGDPELTADLGAEIERLIGESALAVGHGFFEGMTYASFLDARNWLADERYAPWELCELSPEQEAVTRRAEVTEERQQQEAAKANQDVYWEVQWLDRGKPFRTSLTDQREIHVANGDFGPLAAAGGIFPLEEVQLFEGEDFIPIKDPTRLHPAQLKTLLLLEPERAAQILQALDNADK